MFNQLFGSTPLFQRRRVSYAVGQAFGNPFGWAAYRQYNKGGNVFEDIVESTVSFVEDPIGYTGDRLQDIDNDIIQPVYREVIQPVGRALEKVGKQIEQDPLTFVAQVAAIALAPVTAGQSLWALPVIAAASTAAHGGSIEQVLTATAISAASVWAGGNVGDLVMSGLSTATDVGAGFAIGTTEISFSTAQTIAQVATGTSIAAINATGAAIQGKDPLAAAIPALVGTASGAVIGQVAQTELFQDLGAKLNEVGATLGATTQKALTGVATAAITSLATGKDLTYEAASAAIGGLINGISSSVDVISNMFRDESGNVSKLGASAQGLIIDLATNITAGAVTGSVASPNMTAAITKALTTSIGSYIKPGFQDLIDTAKAAYDKATDSGTTYGKEAETYNNLITQRNDVANGLNAKVDEQRGLYDTYTAENAAYDALIAKSKADPTSVTQAELDDQATKVENAANAYTVYADNFAGEYTSTMGRITELDTAISDQKTVVDAAGETYAIDIKAVNDAAQPITDIQNDLAKDVTKNLVKELDPNFDEEAYKRINNLGPAVNAYEHYTTTGKNEGLYTNYAAAEAEIDQNYARLMREFATSQGRDIMSMKPEEVADLKDKLQGMYGDNLSALKDATAQSIVTESQIPFNDFVKQTPVDSPVLLNRAYGDWLKPPSNYSTPTGTKLASQSDVISGKAYLSYDANGNGAWVTSDGSQKVSSFDVRLGDMVVATIGAGYQYVDEKGNIHTSPEPVQPGDVIVFASREGSTGEVPEGHVVASLVPRTASINTTTPEELSGLTQVTTYAGMDRDALIKSLDNLPDYERAAAEKVLKEGVIDTTKKVVQLAESTGNTTLINTTANVIKAGGGLIKSFGGVATLLGSAPKDSDLGKMLEDVGKAANTEEYRNKIAAIEAKVGNAKGVGGTLNAIWEGFKDAPAEFLAEYVGVEGFQEVAPLLIGAGAGSFAKGAALAKGVGEKLATQIGTKAGIQAALISDVTESAGGQAVSAYETAYKLAKDRGMSEADAVNTALDIAGKAGFMAGALTLVSSGIGGMAVEKALLGDAATGMMGTALDKLWDFAKTGTLITIKEGVAEAGEEGLSQLFLETQLYKLDPTRDVAANVTSAASFGAIAGGGISGGAYAGVKAVDVLNAAYTLGNAQFTEQLKGTNYTMGELGAVLNQWLPETSLVPYDPAQPRTIGIRDIIVPAVLANSPQYALKYDNAKDYVDAIKNELGVWEVPALDAAKADKRFANQVVTFNDAKQILIAQGYDNPTDAQTSQYMGVGNLDYAAYYNQNPDLRKYWEEGKAALDPNFKDATTPEEFAKLHYNLFGYNEDRYIPTYKEVVEKQVDQSYTTGDEVRAEATKWGLDLSDEQVSAYTGVRPEDETLSNFEKEYAPEIITGFYDKVLERDPDAEGLTNWVNDFNSGTHTLEEIEDLFKNSSENIVQDTYQEVFKRDPDAEGLQYWQSQLDSGDLSREDFVRAIQTSEEGIKDERAVVQGFYKEALYRDADEEGLQYWSTQLATGALNYEQLKNAIESSTESQDKNDPLYFLQNPTVMAEYRTGKVPTPGMTEQEYAKWHYENYGKNEGRTDTTNTLVKRDTTYSNDIAGFYNEYLGRDPEPEGLAWWENALNSGIPIDEIERSIANSSEAHMYSSGTYANPTTIPGTVTPTPTPTPTPGTETPTTPGTETPTTPGTETPTTPPPTTPTTPTEPAGPTPEEIAAAEAERRRQIDEYNRAVEAERRRIEEHNRAVEAERKRIEEHNKKVTNYNNFNKFIQQVGPSATQTVEAKTPTPEPIEYFYNFEDIFANPKQSSFYKSPYESMAGAKGDFGDRYTAAHQAELASGKVKGSNEYVYNTGGAVEYTDMDDIIRILRGK